MRSAGTPVPAADLRALAGLAPRQRALVALALALLVAFGLARGPSPAPPRPAGAAAGDAALYRAIAGRVARGEPYYPAAAAEQRARRYPLRPFVTVRPPPLALVTAALGPGRMLWLLRGLGVVTVAAFAWALRRAGVGRLACTVAAVLLLVTVVALAQPLLAWWHEVWAGLLVTLALAWRGPGRWGGALACGLLAATVRELAWPLLPVMAVAAWGEGARREAYAWAAAALLALGLLALHGWAVAGVVRAGDARSAGWAVAGGWPFILRLARECTLLTLLPAPLAALLVPLALFGWAARQGALARRVTLLLAAWIGAFLLIGRPDNSYWGLLLALPLTAGLALAPAALQALLWPAGHNPCPRPASKDF